MQDADDSANGAAPLSGATIITGTIGDDIHVVGLRLVEHALRGAGAKVVSLGILTPLEEFVDGARETDADAVFISSSNGHARISCEGIRDAFIEAGLDDIHLYIGGNLVVGHPDAWDAVEALFLAEGFDRVYPVRTDPRTAIADLAADLDGRADRRTSD